MTSDTKGAARSKDETYPRHCVCVFRIGSLLWMYNPAFDPASMPSQQRIGQITKIGNGALWTYCTKHKILIGKMHITGVADSQERCMS